MDIFLVPVYNFTFVSLSRARAHSHAHLGDIFPRFIVHN